MIEIVLNGEPTTLAREQTLEELCTQLRLPARGVAVAVNFELIPKARTADITLRDRDVVEIVTATAGG